MKKCKVCKKELKPYQKKYCSRKCHILSVKVKRVKFVCKQCGKVEMVLPSRGNKIFCSKPCFIESSRDTKWGSFNLMKSMTEAKFPKVGGKRRASHKTLVVTGFDIRSYKGCYYIHGQEFELLKQLKFDVKPTELKSLLNMKNVRIVYPNRIDGKKKIVIDVP